MIASEVAARLDRRTKVDPETGCHNWTGCLNKGGGYGQISVNGQTRMTHIVSWELENGPVPEGLELDHQCRNRRCRNNGHLEPVTHQVNVLRGEGIAAKRARQTHCKRGHEFTPDNIYRTTKGGRACKICTKRQARLWKAKRRAIGVRPR